MHNYKEEARAARLEVLEMIYKGKSSHIGSNFSVIDILTVLFANLKEHDQVLLSAGWKAAAFYYFLAKQGHFPQEELDTYNQEGSRLIGLTEPGVPGVLFAGGSMQMGFPAAVGFALAKKIKGEEGKVYCIASDGELAGGMVWESLLIAKQHKLDNLIIIVDVNGLQAMGATEDILVADVTDFVDSITVDGHNYQAIENALKTPTYYSGTSTHNVRNPDIKTPLVIGFLTIKGKGVSWMENDNQWHYKDLSENDYIKAQRELLLPYELVI